MNSLSPANRRAVRWKVPLKILDLHQDGLHLLISVSISGKSFWLVLDTGASKTALDRAMLTDAFGSAVLTKSDRLCTGLGTNSMESFTMQISDLYIGHLSLMELTVAVLDLSAINIAYRQLGHPVVLGVLGSDTLMQYNAVINYRKKELTLSYPSE